MIANRWERMTEFSRGLRPELAGTGEHELPSLLLLDFECRIKGCRKGIVVGAMRRDAGGNNSDERMTMKPETGQPESVAHDVESPVDRRLDALRDLFPEAFHDMRVPHVQHHANPGGEQELQVSTGGRVPVAFTREPTEPF